MKRTEVAVMSFGPVTLESDFTTAARYHPPTLTASGRTPMGEAIEAGLDLLDERKAVYRREGISYYRPWVFLITDGSPTDDYRRAALRVADGESKKTFSFFSVGVAGADMGALRDIGVRAPVNLVGLNFAGLFSWLSSSMSLVSRSRVGDEIRLTDPTTGPSGWATV
jgi:uncharacterized protein YegL